ncbi:MAG: DUF5723 family protein [Balneolales bacterium]
MKKKYGIVFWFRVSGLCLTFLLFTSLLHAQRHTTARNLGLGGGGTAYMTDFHANFINPANLMLKESSGFAFGLLNGMGANGGGELVDMSVYQQYFTSGMTIDNTLTLEISDQLFGTGAGASRKVGLNALDAVLMGFSIKTSKQAFSLAFRARALASFSMSKGFFELGLGGLNGQLFSDYKAVDIGGDVLTVGEVSLGYAREVWSSGQFGEPGSMRLSAGFAPKFMAGFDYYRLNFNSRLRVSEENRAMDHIFDYEFESAGLVTNQIKEYHSARQNEDGDPVIGDYMNFDETLPYAISPKGYGMGMDIGITYEVVIPGLAVLSREPRILRIAVSATDLGSVNFNSNPGRFSASDHFEWNGFDVDFDEINSHHDSSLGEYSSHILQDSIISNIYGDFSPDDLSGIRVDMMPMVNLGAVYSAGKWNIMVDLGKGLNTRATNSRHVSTALGIEYNAFRFIPLRAGIRTGGELETSYSLGTGINLKPFKFTVGVMAVPDLVNGSIHGGAAWSGLMLRF